MKPIPPAVRSWLAQGESVKVVPTGGPLGVFVFSPDDPRVTPGEGFDVGADLVDLAVSALVLTPLDDRELVASWLALSRLSMRIGSVVAAFPLATVRTLRGRPRDPFVVTMPAGVRLRPRGPAAWFSVEAIEVPPMATAPNVGPCRVALSWEGCAVESMRLGL